MIITEHKIIISHDITIEPGDATRYRFLISERKNNYEITTVFGGEGVFTVIGKHFIEEIKNTPEFKKLAKKSYTEYQPFVFEADLFKHPVFTNISYKWNNPWTALAFIVCAIIISENQEDEK